MDCHANTVNFFIYFLFGVLNKVSVLHINNSFRKLFSEKSSGGEIESLLNILFMITMITSLASFTGTFVNKFSS